MMGSLAAQDTYYDPMTGLPIGAQEPPRDPRAGLPDWAMGALANPGRYEAAVGMWPAYKPPKELPDVGDPLVPSGPRWKGNPTANRVADVMGQLAIQSVVPQDPLDAGLMLATGPGRAAYKVAAGAMGAVLNPDEAEAALLRRDPRLWSAISGTKLRKPLDEMAHQFDNIRTPEQKILTPEDLLGGWGVFHPYDLSRANRRVTHVDDVKLERPVEAHGGVGFSEANPGLAAASEAAFARPLDNRAAALAETGKPVYTIPITMSESGIDASHHVADPLAQMVQQAPITKADHDAFNAMMREKLTVYEKDGKTIKKAPNWVNTDDPKFEEFIRTLQGGMTTKALMADRMALAQWQAKGFPDVAAVRHAMTEPGLIGLPRNTGGMAISRYEPGKGLLESPHPSYSKGVAGQHMGQLAELLPFETFAPSITEGLAVVNARNKALGKKQSISPAYHLGKPTEGVPTAQYFDDQWLEGVMKRRADDAKDR